MTTKLGHDITIHIATKILEKKEILGKTYVATESLVATRIKGIGNNLSRDKETGSRQLNEEAVKNDVVTKDIRSRLPSAKKKKKKKKQRRSQQALLGRDLISELGHLI